MNASRIFLAAWLLVPLGSPSFAAEPPPAEELLSRIGLSDDDKKKVLAGEYLTSGVPPVSERDLSIGVTFLAKATPDELVKYVESAAILESDPQVKKHGQFRGPGSLMDVSRLRIDPATASRFASAKAGPDLNLSTAEVAAFQSTKSASPGAAGQQLQRMLLARFQAYKASGLAGIAPYDRGESSSDVAGDLRKAAESTVLKKYLPQLETMLVSYPAGTVAGADQSFHWVDYDIDGTRTFVLSHVIVAPLGDARVVIQRQYYASTGYNAEQAVAAFVPVVEGTVVVYRNHTFTEQVAGWGGSTKRSIGRGIMTRKLEAMFDRARETK